MTVLGSLAIYSRQTCSCKTSGLSRRRVTATGCLWTGGLRPADVAVAVAVAFDVTDVNVVVAGVSFIVVVFCTRALTNGSRCC